MYAIFIDVVVLPSAGSELVMSITLPFSVLGKENIMFVLAVLYASRAENGVDSEMI